MGHVQPTVSPLSVKATAYARVKEMSKLRGAPPTVANPDEGEWAAPETGVPTV